MIHVIVYIYIYIRIHIRITTKAILSALICTTIVSSRFRRNSIITVLRYSLPVLKIYSTLYIHYRFSVLTVNTGTQPIL